MKKYYVVMSMIRWHEIEVEALNITRLCSMVKQDEDRNGIVGMLPVFTNKKKAERWCPRGSTIHELVLARPPEGKA